MSEKRFKLDFDNHSQGAIMDRQDKYGQYCRLYDFGEVGRQQIVDLLNNQQATIIGLQEIIIDLKDDKNQLHKVISKLGQEVAELKTRNAVLSSKLNQIPKSIREVWLE